MYSNLLDQGRGDGIGEKDQPGKSGTQHPTSMLKQNLMRVLTFLIDIRL